MISRTHWMSSSTSAKWLTIECQAAEKDTRIQREPPLWHHLRFDCVTASRLSEVAHCKTAGGFLVESILGAARFSGTKFTKRGAGRRGFYLAVGKGVAGRVRGTRHRSSEVGRRRVRARVASDRDRIDRGDSLGECRQRECGDTWRNDRVV